MRSFDDLNEFKPLLGDAADLEHQFHSRLLDSQSHLSSAVSDSLFLGESHLAGGSRLKAKKRKTERGEKKVKKPNNNKTNNLLQRKYKLSPGLAELIGVEEESRGQVTSKMWAYIREKGLQDPMNKRQIRCDDRLRALLGVDEVNLGTLTKYLAVHFIKEPKLPLPPTQQHPQQLDTHVYQSEQPQQELDLYGQEQEQLLDSGSV